MSVTINTDLTERRLTPRKHRRVATHINAQADRVIAEARRRHEQQSAFLARVIAAGLDALGSKN